MTQERSLEMQSCKELRPANVYDVAANETWLEDLARQGWRLTGMTGWNGVFQRAEPAVCRYRMQPLSRKEKTPPEDVIELYAALGWEYVCTLAGLFHIWRCDDPETPELDTDPVVQGMGYRYLKKRMVWDTIQTGVLFLAWWGCTPGSFKSGARPCWTRWTTRRGSWRRERGPMAWPCFSCSARSTAWAVCSGPSGPG